MTMRTTAVFAVFLLVGQIAGQDLPLPPAADPAKCNIQDDSLRLDCYPEKGASSEGCLARGCCWSPIQEGRPWCFYPEGFAAYEPMNETGALVRKYRSQFPSDARVVQFEGEQLSNEVFKYKIYDGIDTNRFVPPYPKLNLPSTSEAKSKLYETFRDTFDILPSIRRAADDDGVVFHVEGSSFIFADQFLQLSAKVATGTLYGAGEHRTQLALDENWTKYTLWNHDVGPRPNTNLYGSHPFLLSVSDSGRGFGIYLHNSNAMEILIQPGPRVTWRTIGGILEFYFFIGPSPADVIRQYNKLIGLPALPPYWGLGFHLCRWGYGSANNTRAVWERMRAAQIPYDTQWNDIDYMQSNNDFTIDPEKYAELPQLIDDIHAAGMHYVAMLDPGISGSEPNGTYPPYSDAVAMDTLVKDAAGNIFVGKVWNAVSTVYPDFTHPRALEYWTKQLREFREKVKYDALWIDMNEPSNFNNGLPGGCPDSSLENPPYVPPVDGDILQTKTLCMTAKHAGGSHYNLHNLFAITEADVTIQAAEDILKKRTFLISRASSPGISRYAGHWSGDNYSDWPEMRASIVELLTFSLYGVPFMGADICGFGDNAERELCNRWTQLGAFYPFSRNHNAIDRQDQDPASFDAEFTASARDIIRRRYFLLPYLYTLLYKAHINGDTVARPLFLEFPTDPIARKIDTSFLWGSDLYIIPVLNKGDTQVEAYLPQGRWFDFSFGQEISGAGGFVTFDAPFDKINLLARGGSILPLQAPDVTTTLSRQNVFNILVSPDSNGSANGSLFWDDGESLDSISSGNYGLLSFELTYRTVTTKVIQWKTSHVPRYQVFRIHGVESVTKVNVNGKPADQWSHLSPNILQVIVDLPLNEPVIIEWGGQ